MKNILVVDDEVATRLAVCHQLKGLEAIIHQSRGLMEVKQVLDSLVLKSLDHAVVDLRLAGSQDGFEVIREISKRCSSATITILTVRNDRGAIQAAENLPAVRHLITKPWGSEALVQAVKECLAGKASGLTLIGEMEGVSQ